METIKVDDYKLNNLNKINIVLGKNGCGKSRMLRDIEQKLARKPQEKNNRAKYITPERGGTLAYEANVEGSMAQNISWLFNTRRKNQFYQFKQQSVAQFRKLETLVLREIEKENPRAYAHTFGAYIDKINSLLENVRMERRDITFKIFLKSNPDTEIEAGDISSGESELISLAIECLIFSKECTSDKQNILLLDEPDVHLHPDLQFKLMRFLQELVEESNFYVLIATHSTAILAALATYEFAHIAFMGFDQKEIEFKPVNPVYRKILPVFGAHPLSNVFNETPLMLVDGEDDERIWQQAVRSSIGRIKVYPCSVDGASNMNGFETETAGILNAVYDNAKAYSLRDRDNADDSDINDVGPIIKFRLKCRNAENLLLTNEVLSSLGTNWNELKRHIISWIQNNPSLRHYGIMQGFQSSQFDRKNHDIKEIRNVLMGIIGSSKPWEVVLGQTIANLTRDDTTSFSEEGSIYSFLGEKLVEKIIPIR